MQAPTRKVRFHKHTGMLIMMQHGHFGGNFCKRCIDSYFKKFTGWTAVAGWWGVISVFVTPCVLLWNTGLYLSTRGMTGPDAGAEEKTSRPG